MKLNLVTLINYCKIRFFIQRQLLRHLAEQKEVQKDSIITIAISTNHTFISQAKIMIASLENAGCLVKLFILNIGLTEAEIESLCKLAPSNVKVIPILIDANLLQKLKISKKWPVEAWSRVLIPDILVEEKVLYLDVDTIVVDKLLPLFQQEASPIAGVKSTYYSKNGKSEMIPNAVNSGVLLMETSELKKLEFSVKVFEYAKSNVDLLQMPDQDSINMVCRNFMTNIEPRYNVMNFFFVHTFNTISKHSKKSYYEKFDFNNALFNPAILHFNGGPFARPWLKKGIKHPYYKVYRYYEEKVNLVNRKT
ncbi:hypothetical protein HO675_05165 [Streptococcus suis]|nr:hypothetical protein [Streptococcus suis]